MTLTRSGGFLGMITPNSFLTQSSYAKLRQKLLTFQIEIIVRTPDDVFEGVSAETAIATFRNTPINHPTEVVVFAVDENLERIDYSKATRVAQVQQAAWRNSIDCIFYVRLDSGTQSLLGKIATGRACLIDLCDFCLGLTPYDKHKGHSKSEIETRVFHSPTKRGKTWKPLLEGGDIHRFVVQFGGQEYINYGPWLGAPREQRFFREPRIVVRQIVSGNPQRIYAGYTEDEVYNTQVGFNLLRRPATKESLKYILAILNSWLMTWFHRERFLDPNKNTFQKILIQDAKTFPIPRIDFSNATDKSRHDKLVGLVDKMMALTPKLRAAVSDAAKAPLQNAVTATDQQIDRLVYELYSLTPEEIALVEGA